MSGIWPPDVGGPASHAPEVAEFLRGRGHHGRGRDDGGRDAGEPAYPGSLGLADVPVGVRHCGRGVSHRSVCRGERRRLLDRHARADRARLRARAEAVRRQADTGPCVRAGAPTRAVPGRPCRVPDRASSATRCSAPRATSRSAAPRTSSVRARSSPSSSVGWGVEPTGSRCCPNPTPPLPTLPDRARGARDLCSRSPAADRAEGARGRARGGRAGAGCRARRWQATATSAPRSSACARARARRPRPLSRLAAPRRGAGALPTGRRCAPLVGLGELPAHARRGARGGDAGDRHGRRRRPEIVTDEENGLLVAPGDSGALARAIRRFFGDDGSSGTADRGGGAVRRAFLARAHLRRTRGDPRRCGRAMKPRVLIVGRSRYRLPLGERPPAQVRRALERELDVRVLGERDGPGDPRAMRSSSSCRRFVRASSTAWSSTWLSPSGPARDRRLRAGCRPPAEPVRGGRRAGRSPVDAPPTGRWCWTFTATGGRRPGCTDRLPRRRSHRSPIGSRAPPCAGSTPCGRSRPTRPTSCGAVGVEPASTFPAFMDLEPFLAAPVPLPSSRARSSSACSSATRTWTALAEAWRLAAPRLRHGTAPDRRPREPRGRRRGARPRPARDRPIGRPSVPNGGHRRRARRRDRPRAPLALGGLGRESSSRRSAADGRSWRPGSAASRTSSRDGENGLLVDPADPPALADALVRVLSDRALASELAAGARPSVEPWLATPEDYAPAFARARRAGDVLVSRPRVLFVGPTRYALPLSAGLEQEVGRARARARLPRPRPRQRRRRAFRAGRELLRRSSLPGATDDPRVPAGRDRRRGSSYGCTRHGRPRARRSACRAWSSRCTETGAIRRGCTGRSPAALRLAGRRQCSTSARPPRRRCASALRPTRPASSKTVRGRPPDAVFPTYSDLSAFTARPAAAAARAADRAVRRRPRALQGRRRARGSVARRAPPRSRTHASSWSAGLAPTSRRRARLGASGQRRARVRAPARAGCGASRRRDVLVLPSRYEGLGRVVIEAFARGRGVVATRAGGILDLVDDGVAGTPRRAGGHDALADALVRVLSDRRLAERARRRRARALRRMGPVARAASRSVRGRSSTPF